MMFRYPVFEPPDLEIFGVKHHHIKTSIGCWGLIKHAYGNGRRLMM